MRSLAAAMAARLSLSVLAIALLFVVASGTTVEDLPQFSHAGDTGPDKWGSLSPNFTRCSDGTKQSPVNIVTKDVVRNRKLKPLIRFYNPSKATPVNNGFDIDIHCDGNVGVLSIGNKNYTFKQMHWHSPSEHRIDGIQYPAEVHLVHQAADGNRSVVSILYKYDDDDDDDGDPFIAKIMDNLSKLANGSAEEASISLGTNDTMPIGRKTNKYYRYIGSLTTPPCTENIIWNVLSKVRSISKEQVQALKAPLVPNCKNNSRPMQPLYGRQIEKPEDD